MIVILQAKTRNLASSRSRPVSSNMPNVSVVSVLEEGDLFEDNGFVKIKRANSFAVTTNVGTSAVGTVTVVIS